MTVTGRDKRALLILAAAAVVILAANAFLAREPRAKAAVGTTSIFAAQKRLDRLRRVAATLPDKEAALKTLSAELAVRDKGLIQADTAAQAQAQILQIFRRLARAQAPPIEIKTVEMGQIRPLGEDYGEIIVPVTFECRVEQLLNLLADITAQPELVSSSEIRVISANQKEKTMTIRLTLAGVAPKRLAPRKKGQASL